MSRRTAEHLSPRSDKNYSDLWAESATTTEFVKQARAAEVLNHLALNQDTGEFKFQTYHRRPLLYVPKPATMCDVGSGIGGVTLAYRKLLPELQIIDVDVDERAEEAAKQSGANAFLKADALQFTQDDWKEVATSLGVEQLDQVVALKTKGEVALQLLVERNKYFPQSVIFLSLIQECDADYVTAINTHLKTISSEAWLRFYLYEGRNYHEIAWVVLPHKL